MIRLAYIASPSYSGSTLLTFLLAEHPAIATVGELKWGRIELDTYLCSCGQLLRECAFWSQVQQQMASRGQEFDLHDPATGFRKRDDETADRVLRARVYGRLAEAARATAIATVPSIATSWRTVARQNHAAIRTILDLQRGQLFLDASKEPVRLMHLLRTKQYDVHLIHLVRDGRAVVHSARKNANQSIEQAAADWAQTHAEIERLKRRLATSAVSVFRYEDLCRDTAGTMQNLFSALGLAAPPAIQAPRTHHILGNRMRLAGRNAVRLDEKWRDALSPTNLAAFDRIAGAANRAYGYR